MKIEITDSLARIKKNTATISGLHIKSSDSFSPEEIVGKKPDLKFSDVPPADYAYATGISNR